MIDSHPNRKTYEPLVPTYKLKGTGAYDRYPSHRISTIFKTGWQEIVEWVISNNPRRVVVESYVGVEELEIIESIERALPSATVLRTFDLFVAPDEVERIIAPYLNGDDPLFGKKCDLDLSDFLIDDLESCLSVQEPVFVVGPGSMRVLSEPDLVLYIDLPKNEIQFRARAGAVTNFAPAEGDSPFRTYKRFYFVDWPVLNGEKQRILSRIDAYVDSQRPGRPVMCTGVALREGLDRLGHEPFRARPWFEPGAWGGQWMMRNLNGLDPKARNYAWSFELIAPENGILLEDEKTLLLEASFDLLMFRRAEEILGAGFSLFGFEFPVRFDLLDTEDGGNLSIQCHPSPSYIHENFGEAITQIETYYMLSTSPGSQVFLGLRDGVELTKFRSVLEQSRQDGLPVDIESYVQEHPAQQHQLVLIPPGAIHGSGKGNVVLEISATPYIFTFKLYDWVRLDLNGELRPLNIERGFDNLDPTYAGRFVRDHLFSKPEALLENESTRVIKLHTTKWHFYEVYRYETRTSVTIQCEGSFLICMVVEGDGVEIETGLAKRAYHFGETFVIPSAVGKVVVHPLSNSWIYLVVTRLKPGLVMRADRTIESLA